jgi:putative peptide zinc metalloprotease protein
MEPDDAALFELLDGTRTVSQLLSEAESLLGPSGPVRLSRLVADLTDRGLIVGVDPVPAASRRESWVARIVRPRERTVTWTGAYFERAYHNWGRAFFHPLSLTLLTLLAVAGFGTFAYLVGASYGTPFVVAHRLAIGGALFIAGRCALVAVHEMAHGLALAHYARRVTRGGIRLVLIFPYAFVDTSEAHFEPRLHRMAISAAGPASDLTMGASFSFACALCPPGSLRDVFFQLAFGGYVGAFFNLNPLVDRDGYMMLVDFLREPRLRRRARRQLARRLSGSHDEEPTSPVLVRYALAGLIWSAVGAVFAVIFSDRYYDQLRGLLPDGITLPLFLAFYIVLFIPVLAQLGLPVIRRVRFGAEEVNRVIE